jgi:uncharacterized protein
MEEFFDKNQLDTEDLERIVKKYHIADVHVFGSRVDGFAREDSDLDIGVRFINGLPSGDEIGKIYGNLASDLQSLIPNYHLDLVLVDEAPLHFQYKIIAKGRLLFSVNQEDSCNFTESVANKYRDYKYFIDDYFEGIRVAPVS